MTLNEALSRVMPFVHQCSYPLAERTIRDAAADFCETTRVLSESVTLNVVAGQAAYSLAPADPAAKVLDVGLCVLDERERLFALPGDAGRPSDGRVVGYLLDGANLQLVATPSKPGTLRVQTVLTLASGVEDLPAGLNEWREAVTYGALYRLLAMPGQAWSDPRGSQNYWSLYTAEVNKAISHSTLDGRKRPLRVRPVK